MQVQILNLTCVLHLRLIILSVGCDVPIDGETLLMTDFINLKIKPTQSFKCTHRSRVCVYIFIVMRTHTCMSIYVCTVFLEKQRFMTYHSMNSQVMSLIVVLRIGFIFSDNAGKKSKHLMLLVLIWQTIIELN
jgi:hypothetical protein